MSEHLTALDATFLELEEADETAHMHIGALLTFDGEVPATEAVRDHLEERLGTLPRYRQRLSEEHTGGLSWPEWQECRDFDMNDHLRRAALPAPGGDDELMEWLSDYWSHRLDRRRPLWEAVVLEGMAGGRWALVTKTHHCMVDGVGSIDVGHLLLDTEPSPAGPPPLHALATTALEPDGHGPLSEMTHQTVGAARAAVDFAVHPAKMREAVSRGRALAELIVRDEVIAAPKTSLNVPIGTTRRYDVVRVPLAELKRIKDALGGTVNDVVLAAATGGLRRMLLMRDEEPPGAGLRAMVPVNIRAAGEQLALGNRVTSLFVNLPVHDRRPARRYAHTVEQAESLKSGTQAAGGATLIDVASHAPPVLHSLVAQSLFASRLFNVTITNVPGPQQTLYALGQPLVEVMGLVPLAAEHCVGIAVLSYAGEVTFGLVADRDTVPDLEVLRAGIEDELDELRSLASERAPAGAQFS